MTLGFYKCYEMLSGIFSRQAFFFIFSCLAILLTGCETEFDAKFKSDPKIYVLATPGGDSTLVQIYCTKPVGGNAAVHKDIDFANVTFTVNGKQMDYFPAKDRFGYQRKGCVYVRKRFAPGDVIRLTASAEGYPEISAETTIPAPAPQFSFHLNEKSLRIDFTDDSTVRDFYGVCLYRRIYNIIYDKEHEDTLKSVNVCRPVSGNDIIGSAKRRDYVDVAFDGQVLQTNDIGSVRVWKDESFNGGRATLNIPLAGGIELEDTVLETIRHENFYKIVLYRFSSDFYNYAKSIDNINNNDFSYFGIAPSSYSFTNIVGGVGLLSGFTAIETDWMSVSEILQNSNK